jgi:Putative transposase
VTGGSHAALCIESTGVSAYFTVDVPTEVGLEADVAAAGTATFDLLIATEEGLTVFTHQFFAVDTHYEETVSLAPGTYRVVAGGGGDAVAEGGQSAFCELSALSRITYDADTDLVTLASDKAEGPTAGTHRLHALEFLARLLSHVPRRREIYVRYYGAYSVRRRAAWRRSGVRPSDEADAPRPPERDVTSPEAVRARRRRWAELLRRIWDVDVETCPRCGERMAILAFTLDPADIRATLDALSTRRVDPRAGPWAERAPPAGDR